MSIEDVVNVTITRQSRPLTRAGFGTLLFLSMHRAWDDLIKYYEGASELLDDGFAETDPAYQAAVSYFAQDLRPELLAVGRLATADAVSVLVTTIADSTKYTIWVDGVGFDFTSDATATSIEIEAGLKTILDDGYTVTAASIANKTFTISGNHYRSFPVGEQFRINGSSLNECDYTVVEATLVSGNTVVEVEETIASESNLGAIKTLTPLTTTNTLSWDGLLSVSPTVASTFFRIKAGDGLHLNYGLSGTMAANLTSIEADDKTGWYTVSLAHQLQTTASPVESENQVDLEEALADAIETRRKMFIQASPDADIVDTTLAADDGTTGSI